MTIAPSNAIDLLESSVATPMIAAAGAVDEIARIGSGFQTLSSTVPLIAARNRALARAIVSLVMGCLLCLMLAGCATTSGLFSLREKSPNAYDVTTESLLALPPSFNQLPKPTPGEPPSQGTDSAQSAEALLDPQAVVDSPDLYATQGQRALLEAAGPSPRNLPTELDRTSSSPTIVDAEAEWRRIQEDVALGKPVTIGKTPVIKKSQGGGVVGSFASWF